MIDVATNNLAGSLIGLVVGLFVQAFILQGACALCNLESVGYLKAFGIVLGREVIFDLPLLIGTVLAIGIVLAVFGWQNPMVAIVLAMVAFAVLTLAINGGIYALLLRVSYFRGFKVRLLEVLISTLLGTVVVLLILFFLSFVQIVA
jgi:hypothetical protein